jgi:GNAT superfamily N-acetyltransferase
VSQARIEIRPTRPDEASLLPAIERSAGRSFAQVPGLEWIADDEILSQAQHRRFVALGGSWLAADGGRAVGFACASPAGGDLHLWQVAVRAEAQRRGIGRQLVVAVVEHGRSLGAARVTLTTFRQVRWNEPFYRSLGFRTLAPQELDERLTGVLAAEAATGIPAERRCAMALELLG